MTALHGSGSEPGEAGVRGDSAHFHGVIGEARLSHVSGVAGVNENGGNGVSGQGHHGVQGRSRSNDGAGVSGHSMGMAGSGVLGIGEGGHGVLGIGKGSAAGVKGLNDSPNGHGILGQGHVGIWGQSRTTTGYGIVGIGENAGALAMTTAPNSRALEAISDRGTAIYARGYTAGLFWGRVEIRGSQRSLWVEGTSIFMDAVQVEGKLRVQNVDIIERISAAERDAAAALQQQMMHLKQQHAADIQSLTETIAALTARVAALES